jgi:calreticulin
MMRILALAVMAVACVTATVYFKETFESDWADRWVVSDWKQDDGTAGKFVRTAGDFYGDAEQDKGIQTSQDARFYAISAALDNAFDNKDSDLVVQFQVRHPQKLDCGGGYIKLGSDWDQKNFNGDSEYSIMFGPDICGSSTKRVHAILTHNGENLLTKKEVRAETDQLSHVYTFVIKQDDTFEIHVDGVSKESGPIKRDWDFEVAKQINDPEESKPTDWVDEAKIADPTASKPADWVEEAKIVDPEAVMPEDWDEEDDGEWEAPTIDNPDYQGPWSAPQIENPDYKGPWVHPKIDNPEWVEEKDVHYRGSLNHIGFELWQVKAGSIFDNIIVTDSLEEAKAFADETFNQEAEKKAFDEQEAEKKAAEEAARKAAEAEDDEDDDDEDEDDEDFHDEL